MAVLHDDVLGSDWRPLRSGQPMFDGCSSDPWPASPQSAFDGGIAVFVNEAAYVEKKIAFSVTQREVWPVLGDWIAALAELMRG